MVAEKKGIIRFYNMESRRPIMTLDSGHLPLLCADWSPGNALQVAAAAATEWMVFDVSRSRSVIICQRKTQNQSHRIFFRS